MTIPDVVRWSGDGERDVGVCSDEEQACDEAKVTPPLAVAPHVHGDDMRWNPNDDGINFNP